MVHEQGLEAGIPDTPEEDDDGIDDSSSCCEALHILTSSQSSGRISPAADQVAVEHEAAEWAKWWQAGAAYDNPWQDRDIARQTLHNLKKLLKLQVHDIRNAAKRFPA